MADITKPTGIAPSLASDLVPPQFRQSGLACGEDIAAGDACYVKSDGKVWRSTGAAATAPAKVRGYAAGPALVAQNDSVTLFHSIEFQYVTGQNPGTDLFLSGTNAGGFATTASTGGTAPIGYVVSANRVYLKQSGY